MADPNEAEAAYHAALELVQRIGTDLRRGYHYRTKDGHALFELDEVSFVPAVSVGTQPERSSAPVRKDTSGRGHPHRFETREKGRKDE